jgi:GT2 family glycosyltransferase
MYFEDIDYCKRVRAEGWKVLYWPNARIVHLLGGSSGVTKTSNLRLRPPRYYYEARAHYFKKHFGISGLIVANMLWSAGRLISFLRETFGNKTPIHRKHELQDIWIGLFTQSP